MSSANVQVVADRKIRISVYLSPQTVLSLRQQRVITGRYVSDIIQEAVDLYLDPPTPLHIAEPPEDDGFGLS